MPAQDVSTSVWPNMEPGMPLLLTSWTLKRDDLGFSWKVFDCIALRNDLIAMRSKKRLKS